MLGSRTKTLIGVGLGLLMVLQASGCLTMLAYKEGKKIYARMHQSKQPAATPHEGPAASEPASLPGR